MSSGAMVRSKTSRSPGQVSTSVSIIMDGAAVTRPHHADHVLEGGDVVFDGGHLVPDIAPRQIPQGHQYAGSGRPADVTDRGRLQHAD